MSNDLCPLCHYNGVELRAEAQRWRLAFQGERALAHALTDRLQTAQQAALDRDKYPQRYEPEPPPTELDQVTTAITPRRRPWSKQ